LISGLQRRFPWRITHTLKTLFRVILHRHTQRSVATLVHRVEVRTMHNQVPCDHHLPKASSTVQGSPLVIVHGIHLCALLDEVLHNGPVPVAAAAMESSQTLLICGIDAGPRVQAGGDLFEVAFQGRIQEEHVQVKPDLLLVHSREIFRPQNGLRLRSLGGGRKCLGRGILNLVLCVLIGRVGGRCEGEQQWRE